MSNNNGANQNKQKEWGNIPLAIWQQIFREGHSPIAAVHFQIVAIMFRDAAQGRTHLTVSDLAAIVECPFESNPHKRPFFTQEKVLIVENALRDLSIKQIVDRDPADDSKLSHYVYWRLNKHFVEFVSQNTETPSYTPSAGLQDILKDVDSLRRKVVQVIAGGK